MELLISTRECERRLRRRISAQPGLTCTPQKAKMWLSRGCVKAATSSAAAAGRRRESHAAAFMREAADFQGVRDRAGLQEFSVAHKERFWAAVARRRLDWISPFRGVLDCDMERGKVSWFQGGRLNVSANCLDRHARSSPEKVALIWERDEPGSEVKVTYRQLLEMTCRTGNLLRRRGVKKGHCVTIYMPPCPLAVASMLACARVGAAHNVVFAGFSAEALAERIRDARSSTVITVNESVRGGKVTRLKATVDEAVRSCPTVRQVFVAMRTDAPVAMTPKDVAMEEEMMTEDAVCEPAAMDSEDVLFLLYTSGSTGKPKGLVHTQAGYLLYTALTHKYVFDYRDGDVFGCVADIGWITGHSYAVYGPLANGGTTVLFESTPIYPDPGRYWEMVERLKINQFYGAPTAIRLLLKYGDEWVRKYDRSSLRTLGSETGGICIAPRPSEPHAEIVPGMAMRPFFGIKPALMDGQGEAVTSNDASGALCLAQPWPGMARSIHGDHQRFVDTYFKTYPGYFFTGDGAHRSKEGYYQITGRLDDVINVSGHRIGTAEIEDVVNQCSAVAESAVVGCSHHIKGQGEPAHTWLSKCRYCSGALRVSPSPLCRRVRICGAQAGRPRSGPQLADRPRRVQQDRQVRLPRPYPVCAAPAKDALGQDHASGSAQGGGARPERPGRPQHAGRPRRRAGDRPRPPRPLRREQPSRAKVKILKDFYF
ncbi:acetyl-coenzyme A synthetase 2-like, mitochondrial isoform X2 [Phyllopteryx taeniolatus]|uniref:acetyl-coenzyme A synthetase 2-like, mitochondrial isoform X2 n=1 Tax=Phyllopteryx taeniolatus TaxID=161469 RepID=UPI002AD3E784|nr:acetyl-coenzyme A synthetase 2-like, mitochondrial isoform X2 [Phyllopteryx taeniolatus]